MESPEIADHVDLEDRKVFKSNETVLLKIPNRGLTFINESGLYSLIFGSQLPTAKKFKRWVTSEVLPAIRKYGKYELPKKKAVREISFKDFITAVFEKFPEAEPEITGISFSEDENGNVITHYHVDYLLPDGTVIKPEDVVL